MSVPQESSILSKLPSRLSPTLAIYAVATAIYFTASRDYFFLQIPINEFSAQYLYRLVTWVIAILLLTSLAWHAAKLTLTPTDRVSATVISSYPLVLLVLFDQSSDAYQRVANRYYYFDFPDLRILLEPLAWTIFLSVIITLILLRRALIERTKTTTAMTSAEAKPEPADSAEGKPSGDRVAVVKEAAMDDLAIPQDDLISQVIRFVLRRTRSAELTSRFAVYVMIAIVLVGGTAAVGLFQEGEKEILQDLEAERKQAFRLTSRIERVIQEAEKARLLVDSAAEGPEESTEEKTARLGGLLENIQNMQHGNRKYLEQYYSEEDDAYKELFERVLNEAQTDWSEVGIRVTIAILTLFLVQIFFSVYRYNRQLCDKLYGKAEALRIVGEKEDSRELLRTTMVAILEEPGPTFGPNAKTPLSEAADLLEKSARTIRK